jgi:hypothetical protein
MLGIFIEQSAADTVRKDYMSQWAILSRRNGSNRWGFRGEKRLTFPALEGAFDVEKQFFCGAAERCEHRILDSPASPSDCFPSLYIIPIRRVVVKGSQGGDW